MAPYPQETLTTLPDTGQKQHWGHIHLGAQPWVIAALANQRVQPVIAITPDNATAAQLCQTLPFFLEKDIPQYYLPDYETLPYDRFSPNQAILSERIKTLSQLQTLQCGVVIVCVSTVMQRLPPLNHIGPATFSLKVGDKLQLDKARSQLSANGYQLVSQVSDPGEFAVRGAILDLFPMGYKTPYRIDLFDDEIDSIRFFDTDTQLSGDKIDNIALMPAKEFPTDKAAIAHFRNQWTLHFKGNPLNCPLYQQVSEGIFAQGIEYYLPLFFDALATFFDYIPDNSLCVSCDGVEQKAADFLEQVQSQYEQYAHDVSRPLLPPQALFIKLDALNAGYKQYSHVCLHKDTISTHKHGVDWSIKEGENLEINHRLKQPLTLLQDYLARMQAAGYRVLICAETSGRREVLLNLLKDANLHPTQVPTWQAFCGDSTLDLAISVAPILQGFVLEDPKWVIIGEAQLMGEQVHQRATLKQRVADPDSIIRNLTELHIGDPVVHIEHGVGRYLGLQHLSLDGIENEFLTIGYANDDKLYVPVAALHLISRYSGVDSDHAPTHKLGSEQWGRVKKKAAEKIRDVAAQLLVIYAKREAHEGFVFNAPDSDYQRFASTFAFDETPDQQAAIEHTLNDMASNKTMDRLVCGDVGFGKTEVAMRAAFLAVQSHKQVAVLVPTTLLAQQHYQNFCDRFADWPVRIEVLSRFKTPKQQQAVLQAMANGKVDIIIGTHKLIQKDIQFHALGLVIIDEEHRFGVRQKEHLKSLRSEVDILTLTATPIPRTLNMAMSSMRDLSIIATPPAKRLCVKTFVRQHNAGLISEAIRREILRGGQVYFIHNNVQNITRCADEIKKWVPEARIGIAHGQMPERELEKITSLFYHQHFNILVCTTIVETGIDIPTANTIIIDKADHFGLAQLHQLRGRVGRSHHQAYAYLLTRGEKAVTKEAEKRLDAIAALEELGAGFMLATHDLEIRGAGELLGDDQSGQIQAIGFSLYTELLEKAVDALQNGQAFDPEQLDTATCEINLRIPTLIPDDYLPDVHTRLILYKRIANAESVTALDELQVEMIDRFGLLKPATQSLFAITALKLRATPLGIKKIDANGMNALIELTEQSPIALDLIVRLIQTRPQDYQLRQNQKLNCCLPAAAKTDSNTRIDALNRILDDLSG